MKPVREIFLEQVLPRMAIQPTDRILDLGCGDGWASRAMAALTTEGMVVGIDPSGGAIREARKLSANFENILFIQADAEENPWQDNFFSRAVMIDALHSLRDTRAALGHLYRVMSPGSRLWIVDQLTPDTDEQMIQLIRESGFTDAQREAILNSNNATVDVNRITALKANQD
jgi:ubiquinone/menaquinone biosynthesis C-methylase UbiE